jgi:HSP20 family protein
MAVVQWNPVPGLMRMREELNRLSHPSMGRGDGEEEATWGQGTWVPPVDIYETEDAFILEAELPGVTTDDIAIEFVENRLILRGERRPKPEAKEEQYRRRERAYGRFERMFLLPTLIDRDHVTAQVQHGVLTLRLPKSEMAKPKRIPIMETEGGSAQR